MQAVGIITSFGMRNDDVAPTLSFAGPDFSNCGNGPPITVVIPKGDRTPQQDIKVSIPIADDEINEHEEGFMVLLEIASAEDTHLVDLSSRDAALCRIRDNDRKFQLT